MAISLKHPDLEELARSSGFQLAGISNLTPPPNREVFIQWIQNGFHGSMQWLKNEPGYSLRLNPANLMPGAKSVIFLGTRYLKNDRYDANDPSRGYIASYAWGKDYHTVLKKKASGFVEKLTAYLGSKIRTRIAVDSAPVLEKPIARSAGLGWQGKNTCLISNKIGSFFFLTGIFIDVEFEPYKAFSSDYCGSCRKCIEACPTGCILPDRTIDARKCVSYLTIEHSGIISSELRPEMGNMIFGCDICQSVCPWNQRVDNADVDPEFFPENEWYVSPRLEDVVKLQPQDFRTLYKNSSISRATRSGFVRNAVVALGNHADTTSISLLQDILTSEPEEVIRAHAAWALGQMKTKTAREILSHFHHIEENQFVLDEILLALEN
jgi:epoxyqueuosine reductase